MKANRKENVLKVYDHSFSDEDLFLEALYLMGVLRNYQKTDFEMAEAVLGKIQKQDFRVTFLRGLLRWDHIVDETGIEYDPDTDYPSYVLYVAHQKETREERMLYLEQFESFNVYAQCELIMERWRQTILSVDEVIDLLRDIPTAKAQTRVAILLEDERGQEQSERLARAADAQWSEALARMTTKCVKKENWEEAVRFGLTRHFQAPEWNLILMKVLADHSGRAKYLVGRAVYFHVPALSISGLFGTKMMECRSFFCARCDFYTATTFYSILFLKPIVGKDLARQIGKMVWEMRKEA
jgi:hypothetical protein